jgi:hypothetical protein
LASAKLNNIEVEKARLMSAKSQNLENPDDVESIKSESEVRKHVSTDKEPAIDISGEEDTGGSNECDEVSLETNLITHKKTKHAIIRLPCDVCDFIAKTPEEYKKHVDDKHTSHQEEARKDEGKKTYADKVKNQQSKKKESQSALKIPCDLCNFKSVSAEDFIKHIEMKHQKKSADVKEYACGRCDF